LISLKTFVISPSPEIWTSMRASLLTSVLLAGLACGAVQGQDALLQLEAVTQAEIGDIVEVAVVLESRGREITSASAFISFDDQVFSLQPDEVLEAGETVPFKQGQVLPGQVYENSTAGDTVGVVQGNRWRGFQLNYVAVTGQGGDGGRIIAAERGVLATFKVRVIGYPAQEGGWIRLDTAGRRRSAYTVLQEPGVAQSFQVEGTPLELEISGDGLLPLPEMALVAGAAAAVDLSQYYLNDEGSAPKLAWEFAVDPPQLLELELQGQTLVVHSNLFVSGAGSIAYLASAEDGRTWQGTFGVVVEPLQIWQGDSQWTVEEDAGQMHLDLGSLLADGLAATEFSWVVFGGSNVPAAMSNGELVIQAPLDWWGQEEYQVVLSHESGWTDSAVIVLLVEPINDSPVIAPVEIVYVGVDSATVGPLLHELIQDVDHALQDLQVVVVGDQVVAVEVWEERLLFHGLKEGQGNVLLEVRDPEGELASAIITVVVENLVVDEQEQVGPPLSDEVGGDGVAEEVLEVEIEVETDIVVVEEVEEAVSEDRVEEVVEDILEDIVEEVEEAVSEDIVEEVEEAVSEDRVEEVEEAVSEDRVEEVGEATSEVVEVVSEDIIEVESGEMAEGVAIEDEVDIAIEETIPVSVGAGDSSIITEDNEETLPISDLENDPLELPEITEEPPAITVPLESEAGPDELADEAVLSQDSLDNGEEVGTTTENSEDADVLPPSADIGSEEPEDQVDENQLDDPPDIENPIEENLVAEAENSVVEAEPALVLADLPTVDIEVGAAYSLALRDYVEVEDGEEVVWKVEGTSSVAATISAEGDLVLTPANGFTGREVLLLSVTDGRGRTVNQVLEITVVEQGVALALAAFPPAAVTEGGSYTFALDDYVLRGDPEKLLWSVAGVIQVEVVIDKDRQVWIEAAKGRQGKEVLLFTATDEMGNTASVVLDLEIEALPIPVDEKENASAPLSDEDISVPPQTELPAPALQLVEPSEYEMFAGTVDSSLVMESLLADGNGSGVEWSIGNSGGLAVRIDEDSGRLHLDAIGAHAGREIVEIVARRGGQEVRVLLKINLRFPLLIIKPLPNLLLAAGIVDSSIVLDDYLEGDIGLEGIRWEIQISGTGTASIDTATRRLHIWGDVSFSLVLEATPLLGNAVETTMYIVIVEEDGGITEGDIEDGEAVPADELALEEFAPQLLPPILSLPERLEFMSAEVLELELGDLVEDPDSDFEELDWQAWSAGVEVDLEGSLLRLSGNAGTAIVHIRVQDLEGNAVEQDLLVEVLQSDLQPPQLVVERRPLAGRNIEFIVRSDEALGAVPLFAINGQDVPLEKQQDLYLARYIAALDGLLEVRVQGRDVAGNEGQATMRLVVGHLASGAGVIISEDGYLNLRFASLAQQLLVVLSARGVGYEVDFWPRESLKWPAELSLSQEIDPSGGGGILREREGRWEELPTFANSEEGILYALLQEPGVFKVGESAEPAVPVVADLLAYPNPFNAAVALRYRVAERGTVQLDIYDLRGHKVRTLVQEEQGAGYWTAWWDGRHQEGFEVGSGAYFYQLKTGSQRQVGKIMLLR